VDRRRILEEAAQPDASLAEIARRYGIARRVLCRWKQELATPVFVAVQSRAQVEAFGIGGERVPRRFSIDIDESCELGGSNRFAEVHEAVMATSPNFYNVSRPVALKPTLVVE
jgi:hypothetical protein